MHPLLDSIRYSETVIKLNITYIMVYHVEYTDFSFAVGSIRYCSMFIKIHFNIFQSMLTKVIIYIRNGIYERTT